MKKYLVYVETGGGNGDGGCYNMYYTIVEALDELSALQQWNIVNKLHIKEFKRNYNNTCWLTDGYITRVIELIEEFGYNPWKELKWV